ncbi:MAG: aldehyde dehydrogenase family protein [Phormidesmis sp. RL_2_1]|nr:aldehyde dehydrogenase family protein [Phormidesmis sp. RL_2_1]
MPELVVDWLKLTPERVQTIADICHRLAAMGGPCVSLSDSSSGGGDYHTRPVGVMGFIYEAFPDLGAIASALSIRTGNAMILKGGDAASRTNQIIASILQSTLADVGLSELLVFPVASTEISHLDVAQCSEIDLIIAHGRPSLVEQILQQASVPVIPSRMGNCYLYWSASGSLDQVYQMIVESHSGTPDAVNRIEKVLLHEAHSENAITRLWNRLQEVGFTIKLDESLVQSLGLDARSSDTSHSSTQHPASHSPASHSPTSHSPTNHSPTSHNLVAVDSPEWDSAYLKKILAFRQVKDGAAAINWINAHSSGHADSIVTGDYTESRRFIAKCRSSSVYVNASPRFVRNAHQTEEIALGMSNHKRAAGGLIGMALMRQRQRIFHGC